MGKINFSLFTKEHYDKLFEEIKQLPKHWEPEKITKAIQEKLTLTIILAREITPETISPLTLYRVRLQPTEGINESKVSSFYYPPDVEQIKMGRANRDKQQVFYCSPDPHTAFFETKDIEVGKTIAYLSKWGVKHLPKPIIANTLLYGIEEGKGNAASIMASGTSDILHQMSKNLPEEIRDNLAYCHKKYQELFTSKGTEYYHISSSIVNDIFVQSYNQAQIVDVPLFIYPSVAKNKESVNFAIRKDFTDDYLYLKEVDKVVITKKDNECISVSLISRGVVNNENIEWYNSNVKVDNINYSNAGVSYDETELPKNYTLIKEDTLLSCCAQHKFNLKEYLDSIKFNEEYLLEIIKDVPKEYSDFKMLEKKHFVVSIPVNGDLFLDNNSDPRKITFIAIPITYNISWK